MNCEYSTLSFIIRDVAGDGGDVVMFRRSCNLLCTNLPKYNTSGSIFNAANRKQEILCGDDCFLTLFRTSSNVST